MVVAGLSGRAQFGYLVYTVCCHLVALPFRANLDQQALPFPSEGAASCGANRALSAVRTHWSRLYRTENYGFGFLSRLPDIPQGQIENGASKGGKRHSPYTK